MQWTDYHTCASQVSCDTNTLQFSYYQGGETRDMLASTCTPSMRTRHILSRYMPKRRILALDSLLDLTAIHSLILVYTAHSRDLTISSHPFVDPSSPPLPYVQERRVSTPSSAVSRPSEAQHWTASWATEFMYSNSYNVPAARIQGMCTESIFRIVSTSLLVGTRVPRPGERAAVPILLEAFPIPPPSFLFTRFRFRLRTILRIPDSTLRAPMRPREDAGH